MNSAAKGHVAALILAAGASSRMGVLKPLLPLGSGLVIERTIRSFQMAGVADIRVVLGCRAERFYPVLARLGATWLMNPDYESGMLSSIKAGLRSLNDNCEAFFLMPSDMPFVQAETIQTLALAFAGRRKSEENENKPLIWRPTYRERRGHPPLIAHAFIPEILSWNGSGGLKTLLARHECRSLCVWVDDPGVLIDLDTPEDYWRHRHC